ncbi:glycosyltransferase family 2 protein [Pisolithus orientalis]|uniref:glycosyltransferase family 2 protein n=1 Tax=Pisolithus orientalis TaxID=936130 RepID=UPI0022249022|nr:glycosyltransferase family 2 protein [Pisolithus orientalis]KAI5987740.1 glycosyltransferase family 2 protein [Pisolithus orientalis]
MASTSTHAVSSGNLVDLVSTSHSATVYPTDDAILAVLNTRFRSDLPYTRISTTQLVAINPSKILSNADDTTAREYEERCYRDTSLSPQSASVLQPHIYQLATQMYLLMRRRKESQSLVMRGMTCSGKTYNARLLVNQILRLSAHSKKEHKVASQIKALHTLLDAFGNSKTSLNPNASRHGRYLELHFNDRGRIESAKVLAFALDKSRLTRLTHEERTYHIFYQFLAGAAPQERDHFALEDPSDYTLLASSGCYRLPSGPFSDDAIAMEDVRVAMRALGFKPKSLSSIFSILSTILLLSNIQFVEADAKDVSASVSNMPVLEQVARLLGVPPEDLAQVLTNKSNYVRKELYTVLLNVEQSMAQRDHFMRDLYAILFAYVVETVNHKICLSSRETSPTTQIIVVDQPGYQSRGPAATGSMMLTGNAPLVSAYGQNGFDEFCINFANELIHSYILRHTFEDAVGYNGHITGDGVALPSIVTVDNSPCVELLRGAQISEQAARKPGGLLGIMNKACLAYKSGKAGDKQVEDMLQDFVAKFGVHTSFVTSPSQAGASERNLFGINHYSGSCVYDVTHFIEKDADMLDVALVTLLRSSTDPFVAKLVSGPSLATEQHSKDESISVQAQVSSRPLRQPTPMASSATGDDQSQLGPYEDLPQLLAPLDWTRLWAVSCIRPNDSGSPNSFDKRRVKAQIRSLLIPDIVARRSVEYVVDYAQNEFCERYVPTMRGSDTERIRQCAASHGWKEGSEYALGHRSIWLAYDAWKTVEDGLRATEKEQKKQGIDGGAQEDDESMVADDGTEYTHADAAVENESRDNLLIARVGSHGSRYQDPNQVMSYGGSGLLSPNVVAPAYTDEGDGWGSEWGKKGASAGASVPASKEGAGGIVISHAPAAVEEVPTSPLSSLVVVHRVDSHGFDTFLPWREKLTIFVLIFILNAVVIFYIVEFGRLLCPDYDKVWDSSEVAEHTGDNDWWVSIQGWVYDMSNFIHGDHSDISGIASNAQSNLDLLVGQDLTDYFPPPLALACNGLVTEASLELTYKNFTATVPTAMHNSGATQSASGTALDNSDWYTATFLPKIKQYRKGALVWDTNEIASQASDQNIQRIWAIWEGGIYDLTDYVNTVSINQGATDVYQFLNTDITDVFKQQAGQDITSSLNKVLATLDSSTVSSNMNCIQNAFYLGQTDFRKTARCQVQNYMLLVFTSIVCASIVLKFLSALQLSPKRHPELQDKFVLCQIPCYTEGEDSLRRTIDSLASMNYDDKRKLLFIICDGNIIGSGNDRTTPRIVLDILGIDPKVDPEPLMFRSIGEGSKQLNYGKVYSGLYEFEGHVVPYMVVVKVGKPTERSKPGNRGKRDSQILLMHFLNRVHFDAPMSPLELEIYHQMRNVIGIDPAFYEYIFTVDADTQVTPDSLNRLVASAADDSSIIGICGETKLTNEEGSWWTMIQVYEYYISHHLSKAFESLFGSVSCLPGCFSLYRIRTADKGRPIIISNRIIDEYAEGHIDTLHKKNLFSLGEDRFLTTLLLKHFPTFKTKFIPDAVAHTMAPESWRVLFSQRRRWINSTIHNLLELVVLPELCGFCCFSMRFFVFIDLLGTLILPATVVYLFYLIIVVATGQAAVPIISIIMLAVTYGLQALIFIIKREFMLVGWLVVYLLSYPVYGFFLPVYSFWCMDDFSWGNTRVVIGEGGNKKILMNEEERFDESVIPLKKFGEYEAETWERGSHRSDETGYTKPQSQRRFVQSRPSSPQSLHQSMAGDYYRNTNAMNNSTSNVRGPASHQSHGSRQGSMYDGRQRTISQFTTPQLPFMPFGGGPGSVTGSDHGGLMQPQLLPFGYQHTGSVYGMMPADPRATMMSNMNMLTGSGSQPGGFGLLPPTLGDARPMSTFSMATSVNAFAAPSLNPNPTDEELYNALRTYLSTQDLMTVTKKTAREAIMAKFPKADLTSRKEFLNQSIDTILSGPPTSI